jgi:1,4-dihydroxy-2-naphthoyl-CoA synthase
MSDYQTILVERRDAVTLITLNRPEALNALNAQVLADLLAALAAFDADASQGCVGADRLGQGLRRRRRHQGDGGDGPSPPCSGRRLHRRGYERSDADAASRSSPPWPATRWAAAANWP